MSVGRSGAMELMLALFNIVQGTISTIMGSAGFSTPQQTVLPPELITSVEECGFFESIPLWAVTLIGGLFITVMSFILIMTVYGRFFRFYIYGTCAYPSVHLRGRTLAEYRQVLHQKLLRRLLGGSGDRAVLHHLLAFCVLTALGKP